MRSMVSLGLAAAALLLAYAQADAQATIVRDVRVAINCTSYPCTAARNLETGEALIERFRETSGTTSQAVEAMSWLGRAALAVNQLERAYNYAAETHTLAVDLLKTRKLADDASLELALGAAIETQGLVRAAQGQRSDAVYFLRREAEMYRDTPIHKRIQKNINVLSLAGQPAPALATSSALDTPAPSLDRLKGKVVVLFFWAHWCSDCKAQAPILATLLDKYRSAGLTIVAPTQLFGYTLNRAPATPDAELQHIIRTRDEYYPFLRGEAVPVSDVNHTRYGVSTTPTITIVDRQGIVRLYRPGRMTLQELEAAVRPLLAEGKG